MSVKSFSEEVKVLYEELKNLKKSPYRKRSKESADKKIKNILEIYENTDKLYKQLYSIDKKLALEKSILNLRENAKEYRDKSLKIIKDNIIPEGTIDDSSDEYSEAAESSGKTNVHESKDSEKRNTNTEQKIESVVNTHQINMTEFDYNTAQKLPMLIIEREDKRTESIRDFLNSIEFYHDTLTNQGKATLIKFILKCKIQGKALSELGIINPNTFEELKKELNKKCGTKDTIEALQTKLNNVRQGQKSMRDFIGEVEGLITRMTDLEVSSQDEDARPALKNANERRGLAFLKKGVNDKYKLILDCARHKDFKEAVQHLIELEPSMSQNETIRYMDRQTRPYHPSYAYNNAMNMNKGTSNYIRPNWQPNLHPRPINNRGNNFINRNNNNRMNKFQNPANSKFNSYSRSNNQQNFSRQPRASFYRSNNYGNYGNYNSNNNRNTNSGAVVKYNANNGNNQIRTLLAIEEAGNDEPTDGVATRSGGIQ